MVSASGSGLVAAAPGPRSRPGRYGPFARWLLGWLFRPVSFPHESVAPLQKLNERATLVYVLRSSSLLHLLYFNFLLWRMGLPIARAATGLGYRIFTPFARWYLGGGQIAAPHGAPGDRATAAVIEAVRQGESALVFLRLPRTLPSAMAQLADPFPALVGFQRAQNAARAAGGAPPGAEATRPVALVPLTLLWRRRPRQLSRNIRDVLFGDPEEPGALRSVIGFLLHRRTAFVKVGTEVPLADEVEKLAGLDDARVARRVRGFLHQHLARETRVVTGPPLKRPERVAEETLRDLTLRRALAEIARERGRADDSVFKEARKDLYEIAARYNAFAVDVLRRLLWIVFNRIYDGIDVDGRGMRQLIETSAKGPLVLCPCHKSHIDYMILSLVCDEHGMQPPHVAAGENLNFWPVGRFLRMGGAFFIRRSFKGDKVYGATLSAYVKRLLRDGFTQEFFIEGGRSRTGKLLPPKFGMLAMEVDAWLTGVKDDVFFAPISISYEKIAEGASYQRELRGGEKEKEDARALLGVTKVLRSRYGRITIRFDAPVSLKALFAERGVDPKDHDAEARRKLVAALGWRVAAGINHAAPLAPMGLTCAALLSHHKRAISEDELLARTEFLHTAALDAGAHVPEWLEAARRQRDREGPEKGPGSGSELGSGPMLGATTLRETGLVERALQSLREDGSLTEHTAGGERYFAVVEQRRMALDYHKNAILHFLVAPAILASALRSFQGQTAPLPELLRRAKALSRLFKQEFIFEPGRPFEAIVGGTLQLLLRWGLAEKRGAPGAEEIVTAAAGGRSLLLLSELVRPFAEGVWLAVDSLSLFTRPMELREWMKATLDRGSAAWLAGRILREEALSKALLENAVLMLKDRGVLLQGEGKAARLSLSPEWQPAEKLASLAAEVDLFLS